MPDYGYLKKYIGGVRAEGRYTFSLSGIRDRFPQSDEAIKKALQRLKNKQEIAAVRKEFYVILPPEYKSKGMLPPAMFIDDLMTFLGRDYYVGLQNAAAFFGTASQQSTNFSVVTTNPPPRAIQTINFNSKKEWPKDDIDQLEVETGYINVSSPELTALDLLFFFDKAGGIDRIAMALAELSYSMDPQKLVTAAKRFPQITTVQRLGFLLGEILLIQSLSDPLAEYLKTVNYFPVLLHPERTGPLRMRTGNKWKVVQNVPILVDV